MGGGGGMLQNGRGGGRQVKVYPYKKVLAMLKGGSFNT